MNFNLRPILESKRLARQCLAARPITEKLRMLDELRERAVTLLAANRTSTARVREDQPDR